MVTRRTFLASVGAGLTLPSLRVTAEAPPGGRKKMAVITTEWRYHSHAWHMAERFLVGYPSKGKWHKPDLEVVSAYVDQKPEKDLSRKRAEEFGFQIVDARRPPEEIQEALRARILPILKEGRTKRISKAAAEKAAAEKATEQAAEKGSEKAAEKAVEKASEPAPVKEPATTG